MGNNKASRFRFRAWIPKTNKMLMHESIITYPIYELSASSDVSGFIWMQSTGLVDKNGVEVFEGDIVMDKQGLIGFIKWEELDLSVGFTVECKKLIPWYMDDANKWEIIGNIYESAELLK